MVTADRVRQNQHKNRWKNRRKKNAILGNSSLTYRSMQENEHVSMESSEEWDQFAYLKNHGWVAYLRKYQNLTDQEAKLMKSKRLSFEKILASRQ